VKPLSGRIALVTGGSTGIGRATSSRLAADGAAVVVNYIGDPEPAEQLVKEIGDRSMAFEADVSNEDQVVAMFAHARERLGAVDVLVNNAGVEGPFQLVDMPLEEWRRVIDVNLTGAFLCAREAARGMIAQGEGGAIVNVTSVHEQIPWPAFSHYCASKSGLKLFSQTIARELAPHRIRVVQVAPGAIETPINDWVLKDPRKLKETLAQIPWGRMGRPEEVAAAIAWLASDDASYVTGASLFADGGMALYPGVT
jgi:glucose 1-dehydrogenase